MAILLPPSVWAAPHIVLDLDSGEVLSQEQAFDPWHPASLAKLMTAFSAFKAIGSGEVSSDHVVRVSRNASRQPPSRMGYRVGTAMTLDNALKLLVVKSANDIAVAIAESLSGSVEKFAERMNSDAIGLGMNGSTFVNPHGLHDDRQIVTARDMALLVRAIHRKYPQYTSLFDTPSVLAPIRTKKGKLIKRLYYSYNLLLERYPGADGFKTGFVCASGYNFIGAATRSGRRLAAIVLGRDSQTSRAVDAARLMTEGFQKEAEIPPGPAPTIDRLAPSQPAPLQPQNMRGTICTKEARAARYEPGAGQAVIDSPWLAERIKSENSLEVVLLDRNSAAVALGQIPLPRYRPQQLPVTSGPVPVASVRAPAPPPVVEAVSYRIPVPTFRPERL